MRPVRIEIEMNDRGRGIAMIRVGRVGRRGPEVGLTEDTLKSVASALLPHAVLPAARAVLEEIVGTTPAPKAAEPEAAPSTDEQLDAMAGGRTKKKKAEPAADE